MTEAMCRSLDCGCVIEAVDLEDTDDLVVWRLVSTCATHRGAGPGPPVEDGGGA